MNLDAQVLARVEELDQQWKPPIGYCRGAAEESVAPFRRKLTDGLSGHGSVADT